MNEKTNGADISMLPLWQMVEAENRRAEADKMRSMQKPLLGPSKKSKPGNRLIHGMSKTKTHFVWRSMKDRCLNHNNRDFPSYGGRGIGICERWLDFRNFIADMGPAPSGMTIDRINNDGNYEPGNCEWTTRIKNCSHTRKTRTLSAFGQTFCIAEWSRRTGIPYSTILTRIKRHHWTSEQALTK